MNTIKRIALATIAAAFLLFAFAGSAQGGIDPETVGNFHPKAGLDISQVVYGPAPAPRTVLACYYFGGESASCWYIEDVPATWTDEDRIFVGTVSELANFFNEYPSLAPEGFFPEDS